MYAFLLFFFWHSHIMPLRLIKDWIQIQNLFLFFHSQYSAMIVYETLN